tara:strand:+ start:214 stop:345 length:132 start_codon:yes stop_codon:yes gene_type:complete
MVLLLQSQILLFVDFVMFIRRRSVAHGMQNCQLSQAMLNSSLK